MWSSHQLWNSELLLPKYPLCMWAWPYISCGSHETSLSLISYEISDILYLIIWVEECWQEGAQSWREEGDKLDTAEQMSGATALLCPPELIKILSIYPVTQCVQSTPMALLFLQPPLPDTPDPGNSISTGCTDHSRTALRQNWGRAVPKCETHLSELSANPPGASGIENLPCPEISILREVTFLQVLTCLGSTETHWAWSHQGSSAAAARAVQPWAFSTLTSLD